MSTTDSSKNTQEPNGADPSKTGTTTSEPEIITNAGKLPKHAAALLFANWAKASGMKGFTAPQLVIDDQGTRWQLVRLKDGFELHGQTNHFALVNHDDQLRRAMSDYSTCVRTWRPLKRRIEEIEREIETPGFIAPDFGSPEAAKTFLANRDHRNSDRVLALQKELASVQQQFVGVNHTKEQLEERIEEIEDSKPSDKRYFFKINRDLSQVKVGFKE